MVNIDDKNFGKRLRAWRMAHNLSQSDLAKQLEVDPQTVSEWERGNVSPQARRLRLLASIFPDTNLDLLINGPREPVSGEMQCGDRLGNGNKASQADSDLDEVIQFLKASPETFKMVLALVKAYKKNRG